MVAARVQKRSFMSKSALPGGLDTRALKCRLSNYFRKRYQKGTS